MKFAVLIRVGPKLTEVDRVKDTLESLFHYEDPADIAFVLVNDGNSPELLQNILDAYPLASATIIRDPRNGRGDGWTDGSTVGVITGLRWIAEHARATEFVLKIDTDSLIIRPFSEHVATFLRQHTEIALIGTYLREPGRGQATDTIGAWSPYFRKLQRLITVWRSEGRWYPQIGFFGRARRVRRLIACAEAKGYVLGESCIGGGYALSQAALQRMSEAGLLEDAWLFFRRSIPEDVILGLLVRAVGLKMADFNNRGEPFAILWRGLCGSPDELLRDGYSIIHSLKDTPDQSEQAIRDFFAAQRRRVAHSE